MTINLFVRDGGCWVLDATVHTVDEVKDYLRNAHGPVMIQSYRV